MIGRCGYPPVELIVRYVLQFRGIVSVGFEPFDEVVVIDVVLFELFAHIVHESHFGILVRRVDLAATLIDGTENRFDARRGLRHERGGSRRGDGQHGDIASSVFYHFGVELRIGLPDAADHRVLLLLACIENFERSALCGHLYRGAVGFQCEGLLYLHGESRRFGRTVTESQCCEHVAFGRDAQSRTTSFAGHRADLFPEFEFHAANVFVFGIGGDLIDDQLDFFQFQVDDVVHHTHRLLDVLLEFLEVERRFFGERFVHVTQQVDRQQAARVVGAERNFAAGVGRHGRKSFVGIAVGNTLADDRVPEHYARFGRFPGVVDDLVPKFLGVDILLVERFVRVNRELLVVFLPGECRTHEFVVDFDRNIGAGHLARIDFGIDETLCVGMFDRKGEHQSSPATVLGHFARRVRVTLHEGDDTGRGERRVEHRTTCGADVRKVVPHAAAPLHQLHLLLVHAEDAAVGVCRILVADDEAVRKRSRLEVVADTGHGTALRDDVAEVVEQFEHLLPVHRIGVLLFDPFDLGGDALVHIARSFFVNMAVRIFQGIFAYPNRSGQVVSVEIFFRRFDRFVVGHFGREARLFVA